jgi:putative FmdB family regulatory protein
MPFYEYQCKRCGHQLESMQKVNDPPLKKCPECGKASLERLMSAPVFRLKGGGWYETDFKSDAEGKKNLADRPEADAVKDDKKVPVAKDAKDTKDAKPADGAAKAAAPAKEDSKPAAAPAAVKPAAARPAARPTTRTTARKGAKTAKKPPARRR